MKSPCYGCEKRAIGCHGSCEKYIAFRGYCDNLNASRFAMNGCEYYISNSRERFIRKNLRSRR